MYLKYCWNIWERGKKNVHPKYFKIKVKMPLSQLHSSPFPQLSNIVRSNYEKRRN